MNDKWAEISIYTTQEATEAVAAVFHEQGAGYFLPELRNSSLAVPGSNW